MHRRAVGFLVQAFTRWYKYKCRDEMAALVAEGELGSHLRHNIQSLPGCNHSLITLNLFLDIQKLLLFHLISRTHSR